MVMRKHQRYFPVVQQDGEALLSHFITVANGPIDPVTVRTGAFLPSVICVTCVCIQTIFYCYLTFAQ